MAKSKTPEELEAKQYGIPMNYSPNIVHIYRVD
jgi:hypothetical protein